MFCGSDWGYLGEIKSRDGKIRQERGTSILSGSDGGLEEASRSVEPAGLCRVAFRFGGIFCYEARCGRAARRPSSNREHKPSLSSRRVVNSTYRWLLVKFGLQVQGEKDLCDAFVDAKPDASVCPLSAKQ